MQTMNNGIRAIRRQRGFSLVVSLSMMIVATLVALAVMRAVDSLSHSSGAGLHAQTAETASRSGLAAGRSWVANNSYEAVALVETWTNMRNANLGRTPAIEIPLHSFRTSLGQDYRVFLTNFNPHPAGAPDGVMEFALQSVGHGQSGARRVLTGLYRVRGLVEEIPKVEFIDSTVTYDYPMIGPEDAVYLGSGYLNDIQGPVTINGSMYLANGIQLNPVVNIGTSLTVNGDLIVASQPLTQHNWVRSTLTATGNAFFGDSITIGKISYG